MAAYLIVQWLVSKTQGGADSCRVTAAVACRSASSCARRSDTRKGVKAAAGWLQSRDRISGE